eukprot:5703877-Amphidinium_carterae.1
MSMSSCRTGLDCGKSALSSITLGPLLGGAVLMMFLVSLAAFISASVKRGQCIIVANEHLRFPARWAKCATRLEYSPLHAKQTLLPTRMANALS